MGVQVFFFAAVFFLGKAMYDVAAEAVIITGFYLLAEQQQQQLGALKITD